VRYYTATLLQACNGILNWDMALKDAAEVKQITAVIDYARAQALTGDKLLAATCYKARAVTGHDAAGLAAFAVHVVALSKRQAAWKGHWCNPVTWRELIASYRNGLFGRLAACGAAAVRLLVYVYRLLFPARRPPATLYAGRDVPVVCNALPAGEYTAEGTETSPEGRERQVVSHRLSVFQTECPFGADPPTRFSLAGITIRGATVACACGCAGNCARALHQRVVLPNNGKDWTSLYEQAYVHAASASMLSLPLGPMAPDTTTYEQWLTRGNFSAEVQRKLRAARNTVRLEPDAMPPSGAFVKAEIVVVKEFDCPDELATVQKPRAIRPISFEQRSEVGNTIYGATANFKILADGSGSFLFCSGRSGEDVGAFFDAARARMIEPVCFKCDFSNMDGTHTTMVGDMVVRALLCCLKGKSAPISQAVGPSAFTFVKSSE
jgi:hypothetical protein